MGPTGIVILLAAIAALGVVVWGAFSRTRSLAVAAIALGVAGLAALLSFYALVETQSAGWAVGYGLAAVLAGGVAVRHVVGRLLQARQ
jgi:hypothetical protein